MNANSIVVAGVYGDNGEADRAVAELRSSGFGDRDISLLLPPSRAAQHARRAGHWSAVSALRGFKALDVPGFGPLAAIGLAAAAGQPTFFGAALELASVLKGAGVAQTAAIKYAAHLRSGKTLLSEYCATSERARRAGSILQNTGAQEIDPPPQPQQPSTAHPPVPSSAAPRSTPQSTTPSYRAGSSQCPSLRLDLDFMPSALPEHPGLFIRDPRRYSDAMLIIPPLLVTALKYLDGKYTLFDLHTELVRLTGSLDVDQVADDLLHTLGNAGFLEDDTYAHMKDEKRRQFANSPVRRAIFAGSEYPDDPAELHATLAGYLRDAPANTPTSDRWLGIVAPCLDLSGAKRCYGAAYGRLSPRLKPRTFAILGVSHNGEPERFGLTRKSFVTPLGETQPDIDLINRLTARAAPAIEMEDYQHSLEYSIEHQLLFLQHIYGPDIKILPILCGAFARSLFFDSMPEEDPNVALFFSALAALAASERDRLFWIVSGDMAYMGRRYGDTFDAKAGAGFMNDVRRRDEERIRLVEAGDADAFFNLIRENHDDLRWTAPSPLYTFLRAVPEARASLLDYNQWNIDETSVITFGAMAFWR